MSSKKHAVVIGGSIAGLCSARALSQSGQFERVTLIERDRLPDAAEHRPGVPQSHHVHALLLRGLQELELLFPGIEAELSAGGAAPMDISHDFAHCTEWGWARRARTGVAPLTLSRLLLETTVRARLRRVPNLNWLEDTRATGLISAREGERIRVTGVATSRPEQRAISADLVVDASGRNSKCLDWLEAQGVARPDEDRVDSFSGYASRFYELAANPARWWRGMLIDTMRPAFPRWGLLMPIEHGGCVVTLGGVDRHYPPHDEKGFLEHANSLMSPALARELERARPLSGIHSNRALWNRARHFERWSREIGGFVTLGDSAIAFNPYHGQGMSMAALSANLLAHTCASRNADPYVLTRDFHRAQWKALRLAWDIATGIDMEWPSTSGKRPFAYDQTFSLSLAIVRASAEYPDVKRLIGPVYQLVASPYTLLKPELIARVLYAELRRRLGGRLLLTAKSDTSAVVPQSSPVSGADAAGFAAD